MNLELWVEEQRVMSKDTSNNFKVGSVYSYNVN